MQETRGHKYGRWFFTLALTLAGILASIFVLPGAIVFFFPFVIGWLIAIMASPLSRWLEKKLHIRKKVGSVLVVVLVLALVIAGLYFTISRLIKEIGDFIPKAPMYLQKLLEFLDRISGWIGGLFSGLPENIRTAFDSFSEDVKTSMITWVRDFSSNFATGVGSFALSVPSMLFYAVITVVSSFILVMERERLWNGFYQRMPDSVQRFLDMAKKSLKKALSGYFMAQLKMSWFVAVIVLVGLILLKVPYALLLSLLIAFIDFLPIFGSGTVLWPWALAEVMEENYMMALWLMVIYLAVQIARNILSPKFMGESMGLSGLMTIFCLFLGFRLYGVIGVVFAVPLGMVLMEIKQYGVFNPALGVLKEMARSVADFLKKPGGYGPPDPVLSEDKAEGEAEDKAEEETLPQEAQ